MSHSINVWDVMPLDIPAIQKSLLMVIATRMSGKDCCWPSVEQLCVDTGFKRRAVLNALKELEEKAYLDVEKRNNRTSIYRVGNQFKCGANSHINDEISNSCVEVGASNARVGASNAPPEVQQMHTELKREIKKEIKTSCSHKKQKQVASLSVWAKDKHRAEPEVCQSAGIGEALAFTADLQTLSAAKNQRKKQIIKIHGGAMTEKTKYSFYVKSGEKHYLSVDDYNEFRERYPRLKLDQELSAASNWCFAAPTRNRKTPGGINRFLNTWLSKSEIKRRESEPAQSVSAAWKTPLS